MALTAPPVEASLSTAKGMASKSALRALAHRGARLRCAGRLNQVIRLEEPPCFLSGPCEVQLHRPESYRGRIAAPPRWTEEGWD
jgi:hypothetical protein